MININFSSSSKTIPRIIIVGAGFAGLFCAKGLEGTNTKVTIIDSHNYHLFQPLLYQVSTGFLSANDIALPIRSLLSNKSNIEVVMDEVTGVDHKSQQVLAGKKSYGYDYLILAVGSRYHFFGHDPWQERVFVLKNLDDAILLRQRILTSLEKAELETDENARKKLLTFVVVGGGPTGVEMAGAIADTINYVLTREFRYIRPENTRIIILESSSRLLSTMPASLSDYAERALKKKNVIVQCNTSVLDIQPESVVTNTGDIFYSNTILWAAGVRPLPIANWLEIRADQRGAIPVQEDLSIREMPNIFVAGDAATSLQDGTPLPALASVAKQQGKYLAKLLQHRIKGKKYKPFRYSDWGTMATIGRNAAVANFGKFSLKGWLAWIAWGLVHIYFLTGFRNRLVVFFTWVWTYLTYGMSSRILIKQDKGKETDSLKY